MSKVWFGKLRLILTIFKRSRFIPFYIDVVLAKKKGLYKLFFTPAKCTVVKSLWDTIAVLHVADKCV